MKYWRVKKVVEDKGGYRTWVQLSRRWRDLKEVMFKGKQKY